MTRHLTPWRLLAMAAASGLAAAGLRRVLPGSMAGGLASGLWVLALALAFAALLRWRLPDGCDSASPGLRRRYVRELMVAMGAYMLTLLVSVWLLKGIEAPVLRALVALAPLPPIAMALRAIVRYIRDIDEMQQRIELEAVCIATAFVSLVYLGGGFLQSARVIDVPAAAAMIWVFPLVCFAYGLAKLVVVRRYR